MIIECPACTSRYRIREDKLPEAGGNIKCPNCAHVFFVPRTGSTSGSVPAAPDPKTEMPSTPAAPPPMPPDAGGVKAVAPEAGSGPRRWKLRNPVGLVYDFPDTDQLRTWLSSRESFDGFEVSYDAGTTWASVSDVPDLEGVRPTGRKSQAPQTSLTFGGASTDAGPSTVSGNFATSADQLRTEAEARLREARATRADESGSVSAITQFHIIKPPANRQQEQTSKVLLLLAVLILPLIAAVGLHIVGVIDLADYGLLPGEEAAPVVVPQAQATEEPTDDGPARPELTPEQAVTILMNQAAAAQSRGEPDVAAGHLERAIELTPDDAQLYCALQPIYGELGRQLDATRAGERCRATTDGSGEGTTPTEEGTGEAAPAEVQTP